MTAKVRIDFMVAGFAKCGTTSVCAALARHPDIFMSDVKEPRYFSSREFDQRHRYYEKLYENAKPGQKLGDGSPSYSGAANAEVSIQRIKANNSDCRFILIARNPRKRIESFYRELHHSASRWGVLPPFAMQDFLEAHPDAWENAMFYDRADAFIQAFGADAVLPILLEDFRADSEGVLRSCCEHIGVDPARLPPPEAVHLNVGTEKYHDTQFLRWLKRSRPIRRTITRMPLQRQNNVLGALRLRVPFGDKPLPWDEPSEQLYRDRVVPQARRFLELCGKPADYWQL